MKAKRNYKRRMNKTVLFYQSVIVWKSLKMNKTPDFCVLVTIILEPIIKGLCQWIYNLCLDLVSYVANELLTLMSLDLAYFEVHVPIVSEIVNVFIAVGWALLLGNLIFQTLKAMFSGLGFEGEDPKILLARTFIFGFLLLVSRQVCDIGLSMASYVINMLALPTNITIVTVEESLFSGTGSAGWLLVIIMGFIMMFQIIKLLFEIGERYVIVGILTFLSPMAFAMGNAKATNDIFKGFIRMFASMMLMMVLNLVFLKMIISAMANVPNGAGILAWMVFIVALARVARKIDNHIGKIGLNPANTGDGLGRGGLPGMLSYAVARTIATTVAKNAVSGKSGKSGGGNSVNSQSPTPNMPNNSGSGNGSNPVPTGQGQQNDSGQNAPPISRNTQNNSSTSTSTKGGAAPNNTGSKTVPRQTNNNNSTIGGQQNSGDNQQNNSNINQQNQQGKNGIDPVNPPNAHNRENSGKPTITRTANNGFNSQKVLNNSSNQQNSNMTEQQNNLGQNNKNKPVLHGNQGVKPSNTGINNNSNQNSTVQNNGNNQKSTIQNRQNNLANQGIKAPPVSVGQQGRNQDVRTDKTINNTNNKNQAPPLVNAPNGQNTKPPTQHNGKAPSVSPAKQIAESGKNINNNQSSSISVPGGQNAKPAQYNKTPSAAHGKQTPAGDSKNVNINKNQAPPLVNVPNGQNSKSPNNNAKSIPAGQQTIKSGSGNSSFNSKNTHSSTVQNQGNHLNTQQIPQRNQEGKQNIGGNNIPSHKNVSGQIPTNNNGTNLHKSTEGANLKGSQKQNVSPSKGTGNQLQNRSTGRTQKVTPQGNLGAKPQKSANNNRTITPISPPNIKRREDKNV